MLASWAIPKGLPEVPKENHFAARTEDHPLEYADFEGEIPKGQYGAGTMRIWDSGTYQCLKWEPRKVEVALHGERLNARYALFAIGDGERTKDWMIHRMDPPADAAREPMPERLAPMLARSGGLPADDRRWAYEIKWDGVRAIAYSTPGELRLESRNLKDITVQYPELSRLNRALSSHSADSRRGDRRPRRGRPAQLRGAPAPHAGDLQGTGETTRQEHARHIHHLRPAVAGRSFGHGPPLLRAP